MALLNTRPEWFAALQRISGRVAARVYSTDQVVVGLSFANRIGGQDVPIAFYIPFGHKFGENLSLSKDEILQWFHEVHPVFFHYSSETMLLNATLERAVRFGEDLSLYPGMTEDFSGEVHRRLGVQIRSLERIGIDSPLDQFSTDDDLFAERASREAALLLVMAEALFDHGKDAARMVRYDASRELSLKLLPLGLEGCSVHEESLRNDLTAAQGRSAELEVGITKFLGPPPGWAHTQALANRLFTDPDGLLLKAKVLTPKTERPSVSREALEAIVGQHPVIELLLKRLKFSERARTLSGLLGSVYNGKMRFQWHAGQLIPLSLRYYGQRLFTQGELGYMACTSEERWVEIRTGNYSLIQVANLCAGGILRDLLNKDFREVAKPFRMEGMDPYEYLLQGILGSCVPDRDALYTLYPEIPLFVSTLTPELRHDLWEKVKGVETSCRAALLRGLHKAAVPYLFVLVTQDRAQVLLPKDCDLSVYLPKIQEVVQAEFGDAVSITSCPK